MAKTSKLYTYVDFANDAIALVNGGTIANREKFVDKAQSLIATNVKKAEYNKAKSAEKAPKGASENTLRLAGILRVALTSTPITTAEINGKLNSEYTALQVANAMKYVDGVKITKVIRNVTNSKGLNAEKEYTAYSI